LYLNPAWAKARRAARRRHDAGFKCCQIMPEIGRRLFRHDEPATVEIEGMDQHQIIRQPKIFNRPHRRARRPAVLAPRRAAARSA
jgi:hypothetical protein